LTRVVGVFVRFSRAASTSDGNAQSQPVAGGDDILQIVPKLPRSSIPVSQSVEPY
jgi:hypothetical protein